MLPGALSVAVGLTDDPVQGVPPAWALSVTQTMSKEAEALQTCPAEINFLETIVASMKICKDF